MNELITVPISRREFEQGQIDLTSYILDILAEYPDDAYSFDELYKEVLNLVGTPVPENALRPALASLETGGRVESREVWGLIYYILKQPIKDQPSDLAEHEAEAVSAQELAEREGVVWSTFDGEPVGNARFVQYALDKLAEVGWLEKRYVRDEWYYAYSRAWDEEEIV